MKKSIVPSWARACRTVIVLSQCDYLDSLSEANAAELLYCYYSQTNIAACQSLTMDFLTTCWQEWWCTHTERLTHTHTHRLKHIYTETHPRRYTVGSHLNMVRSNNMHKTNDWIYTHTHTLNPTGGEPANIYADTDFSGGPQGEENCPLHLK